MTTSIDDQLRRFVLPALRDYWDAESALSAAAGPAGTQVLTDAREAALRRARTAATELHHLADFALKAGDPRLPPFSSLEEVRRAVSARCVYLRGSAPSPDVALLRDIADAFKHQRLDRKNASVASADAVIACQTGYGRLSFGEGKFGGVDQVVVTDKFGGQRALTSVLQNVVDAWRALLGQPLPPLNDFDG